MNYFAKPLTWDDLARCYGRSARAKPMDEVFDWAARQTDRFVVDDEGQIYQIKP